MRGTMLTRSGPAMERLQRPVNEDTFRGLESTGEACESADDLDWAEIGYLAVDLLPAGDCEVLIFGRTGMRALGRLESTGKGEGVFVADAVPSIRLDQIRGSV